MRHDTFLHFLRSYVAVQPEQDLSDMLRTFAQVEREDVVDQLRRDVRELIGEDLPDARLREMLSTEGNYLFPEQYRSARDFLIDMFERLQTFGRYEEQRKPYDVFISYSSQDRPIATRLASELKHRGYAVWLDQWEILVGHNIVDEVYRGLTSSEFVVVVLTEESCKSKWVSEELTHGRLAEIERRQIAVLPAKFGECEIPAPLRTKRYADFTKSWEEGFRELTTAIDLHRLRGRSQADAEAKTSVTQRTHSQLESFYNNLLPELVNMGFRQGEAYKDIAVGAIDGEAVTIARQNLEKVVDDARVQLRGWGGASFPYDTFYPNVEKARLSDGLRVYDSRAWPYEDWSFHFWQINERLQFVHRMSLSEDHMQDDEQYLAKGGLDLIWALKDICVPLLFARNLLVNVKEVENLAVLFYWGGMKDRRLIALNPRRISPPWQHICHEDVIALHSVIDRSSDLRLEAIRVAKDLFWFFEFDLHETQFEREVQTLLDGRMTD